MRIRCIYDTDDGDIVHEEEAESSLSRALDILGRLKDGGNQLSIIVTDGVEVCIFRQTSDCFWVELWSKPRRRKLGAEVDYSVARRTVELAFDWPELMRTALMGSPIEWHESALTADDAADE